jgi:hypothetical protein
MHKPLTAAPATARQKIAASRAPLPACRVFHMRLDLTDLDCAAAQQPGSGVCAWWDREVWVLLLRANVLHFGASMMARSSKTRLRRSGSNDFAGDFDCLAKGMATLPK